VNLTKKIPVTEEREFTAVRCDGCEQEVVSPYSSNLAPSLWAPANWIVIGRITAPSGRTDVLKTLCPTCGAKVLA
jgi:endogenous inhibitor of DNA gyrase (YacG/DUF329 family)